MQNTDRKKSHIIISTNIEEEYERLKESLAPSRSVGIITDKFLIEDAKAAISEAYISESEVKYIILGANQFTTIAQNSLLKMLEEPPRNIEFIIISPTRTGLLLTVRSRLAIAKGTITHEVEKLDIDLTKIGYREIFEFLKEHARDDTVKAKAVVRALYYRATVTDMLILSTRELDNFDTAYRALELNAKAQSVYTMLLMGFVGEARYAS